jgi:potassium intermediate/small conductance calcium-activated channel subfamily N protein 2
MEFEGKIGAKNYLYLYLNILIMLMCCCFVVMREFMYLEISQERRLVNTTEGLISSGRWRIALKDCLILALQPYPFFFGKRFFVFNKVVQGEIYYYYNDIMGLFAIFRLCYFLSSTLITTKWKSCSADRVWYFFWIIDSQMYGCEANTLFAIRSIMKVNPFTFNIVIMMGSILIFGQALRICEGPLVRVTDEMDHSDFINSCWAVILTMTTGKAKIIVSRLWGFFP